MCAQWLVLREALSNGNWPGATTKDKGGRNTKQNPLNVMNGLYYFASPVAGD